MSNEAETSNPASKTYRNVDQPWHKEVAEYLHGRISSDPKSPFELSFQQNHNDEDLTHIIVRGTPDQIADFDRDYRYATSDFDIWRDIKEGKTQLPSTNSFGNFLI